MERKEAVTQVLNDLVKINNDRIKEYKKASQQISDFDWRTIFLSIIDESRKFSMELSLAILKLGGAPQVTPANSSGRIYRIWKEIKDTFTGKDRESILNECEFVEDAIQRAYVRALEHEDWTAELKQLIKRQFDGLRSSHQAVNGNRDLALLALLKIRALL